MATWTNNPQSSAPTWANNSKASSTFTNRGRAADDLVQEDGLSRILQEDGSTILLETFTGAQWANRTKN